jgi:hypothetical protein
MLLPNTHSFLLVRSANSEPVIQPSIQESITSSSPSSSSDSGGKFFLPNYDSFLLVRSETPEPVIQPSIQESASSWLPSSLLDSGKKMLLPNYDSFLLVRPATLKPVVQPSIQESPTSWLPSSLLGSSKKILLPNSHSFLLVRSSTPGNSIIGDKDKRAFLKTAGIAGASIAASLLLPKKAEALIMGSSPTTGVVGVKDSSNTRINPATEETVDSLLKPSDLTFDDDGALEVKVTSIPAGAGTSSSSFSDSGDEAKSALVDDDRHVQVDVLSSALPAAASTENTLETISFGGFKLDLRMITEGNFDYIGEAGVGTADSADDWRVKRIDYSTGVDIAWAGDGGFNHVWDQYASLDYHD